MALGSPVQLRLKPEKQLIYEAEAAARDLSLPGYLRWRLEGGDGIRADLAELQSEVFALRQLVERLAGERTAGSPTRAGGGCDPMLTETLLLLRSLNKPANLQMVQSELRRLGIPVWDGGNGDHDGS